MAQRLYRDTENKVFFGVASGIAKYFNVDPLIIRLIFVAIVFAGGSGILAYIICFLLMPKKYINDNFQSAEIQEENSFTEHTNLPREKNNKSVILGATFIILGLFFLVEKFVPIFSFKNYYPLLMIAIGAAFLVQAFYSKVEAE